MEERVVNTKFFKVLMTIFVISLLCISNSYAFDATARDDSSRVTVGQHDLGDVLLGDIYQTAIGFQTTIKVVNTSATRAVVARVTFRSAICSCDVLDFAIYLTPTDVWEGVVKADPLVDGGVIITSSDDSVMRSDEFEWDGTAACNPFKGNWATDVDPMQQSFNPQCLGAGDTLAWGHFEVIGLASYPATAPMSKDTLAMAYGFITGVPAVPYAGLAACDFNLGAGGAATVPNVLMGTITLENSVQRASINMTALKNFASLPTFLPVTQTRALDGMTAGQNTLVEIEAALAKTSYAIPFDLAAQGSDVILINTLPTLYMAANSAYFTTPCIGMGGINYIVYDMEETVLMDRFSPAPGFRVLSEVTMQPLRNVITEQINAGFTEGWMNVIFPPTAKPLGAWNTAADTLSIVTYTGAPTLNSYVSVDANGDLEWKRASSPESAVTYSTLPAPSLVRQ